MPRLKHQTPKYRKHKATGQAVVTLSGKDYYLGRHGSRASRDEYDRLIAEWLDNGRQLPSSQSDWTITELCAAYWPFAKSYYVKNGKQTDECAGIRVCLRFVRESYGRQPVREFGPMALKSVRQRMIDAGQSRGYINQNVGRIKRMFRWAVENEYVDVAVYQALLTVAGLQKDKTKARETAPVLPVGDEDVDKTLAHLDGVTADLVRFQRLTGCRPGEACSVRPCDVDRTGDIWMFKPKNHKNEHRGRGRIIFLGPKSQAILKPYLLRDSESLCFIPPRGKLGKYNRANYRERIHRACVKAGVPKWAPNRLRHAAGTEIRRRYGLEAAQVTLGHANADVTQVYAERDLDKARAIMREVG